MHFHKRKCMAVIAETAFIWHFCRFWLIIRKWGTVLASQFIFNTECATVGSQIVTSSKSLPHSQLKLIHLSFNIAIHNSNLFILSSCPHFRSHYNIRNMNVIPLPPTYLRNVFLIPANLIEFHLQNSFVNLVNFFFRFISVK